MSLADHEKMELGGKVVLLDGELRVFSLIMKDMWKMDVKFDFGKEYKLARRFEEASADVAVYSVVTRQAALAILSLPEELRVRFVAVQNKTGQNISGMSEYYHKLESTGVVAVWEGSGWSNDIFGRALLGVLAK